MSELPQITARELARDIAFGEALERHAKGEGSAETVAWCALRAIERAAEPQKSQAQSPPSGTAEQAMKFALKIDDHFDMREFLKDWLDGRTATGSGWTGYRRWLRNEAERARAEGEEQPA